MNYKEQLQHPKWQRRRLERLEASNWKCTDCAAADKQLHVHHERYIAGRMAWDYPDDLLTVLCHPCHDQRHAPAKKPTLISSGNARLLALLAEAQSPEERAFVSAKLSLQALDQDLKALFESGPHSTADQARVHELMASRKTLKATECRSV